MSAAMSGSEVTEIDGSGGTTGGGGGTLLVTVDGVGRGVVAAGGGGCGVGVAAGCFFTHAAEPASNETIRTRASRLIGVLNIIIDALIWSRPTATSSDRNCCLRLSAAGNSCHRDNPRLRSAACRSEW